jgi:hypothetical protein
MTDATLPPSARKPVAASTPEARAERLRAGLKRRYAREARFKLYGLLAIGVAVGFLLLLLGRIIEQGHTAFYAHSVTVPVYMDPARVDRGYPQGTNFELLVAEQQLARFGVADDADGSKANAMRGLFSSELKFVAAERIQRQIGQTLPIAAPLSDDADLYYKGQISRDVPADQRRLSDQQLDWLDQMKASGQVTSHFNTALFTNGDSTEPELAGVLGAVVGSALMLMVTALIAIPLGVGAAVYLEEFAPKGRLTDLIEVNINNLAAVPSIIYAVHQLDAPAARQPDRRRTGSGPDGAADHHHRRTLVAEGGAALDPRGGAGHGRVQDPDGVPAHPSPCDAGRDDGLDHLHGPRARRDSPPAADRHGQLHSGHPAQPGRADRRPALAGLHLGERLRAGLP